MDHNDLFGNVLLFQLHKWTRFEVSIIKSVVRESTDDNNDNDYGYLDNTNINKQTWLLFNFLKFFMANV